MPKFLRRTLDRPICPTCRHIELRRQGRHGLLETTLLPRLGIFPWECGQCRAIYLVRARRLADYGTDASQPAGVIIRA